MFKLYFVDVSISKCQNTFLQKKIRRKGVGDGFTRIEKCTCGSVTSVCSPLMERKVSLEVSESFDIIHDFTVRQTEVHMNTSTFQICQVGKAKDGENG